MQKIELVLMRDGCLETKKISDGKVTTLPDSKAVVQEQVSVKVRVK